MDIKRYNPFKENKFIDATKFSIYQEGISIIISAYKTQQYIDSCLESVFNQNWFKTNNNWEVIVICDGDYDLYNYLKPKTCQYKNFRLMCCTKNVGTYVAFNTAAKEARYSWLLRFDSDDEMYPDTIETFLSGSTENDVVYTINNRWGREMTAVGQVLIKHSIFDYFGGFKPWYCSADGELKDRVNNWVKIATIKKECFLLRYRENSLTTNEKSNSKSFLRKAYNEIKSISDYSVLSKCIINYSVTNFEELNKREKINYK